MPRRCILYLYGFLLLVVLFYIIFFNKYYVLASLVAIFLIKKAVSLASRMYCTTFYIAMCCFSAFFICFQPDLVDGKWNLICIIF